jgi:dolichol kinase
MFFGIFIVTMLYFEIFNIYHLLAILIVGLTLSKLCCHFRIPLASWVMDKFERPEYRYKFPGKGPIFFMIGTIIVVYFFPLKTALASILILSLGDGLSHIFGKLLSRKNYKYLKSVEGTLVAIVFSFFGAMIFVSAFAAFIGTVSSLLLENLKIPFIDDNLFVPVVAALVISIL